MTSKMNWGRANRQRRMWDRGVSNVVDEKERSERDRAARWLNRPQPTKPTRWQQYKPKSGNGKTIVIIGDGHPCPRCGVPTQIREHNGIGDKQLRKQFYYSRWFYCMNKRCQTTVVTSERYKVMNPVMKSDNDKPTVMRPDPADPNERPPWE